MSFTVSTYDYTGTIQDFVVPSSVTEIVAFLWGAGGGAGYDTTLRHNLGGGGGYIAGIIPVAPGETLKIIVGGGGQGTGGSQGTGVGGWGGDATYGDGAGGSTGGGIVGAGAGGGRSAVVRDISGTITQLISAGAGGGGGGSTSAAKGGGGGGSYGQDAELHDQLYQGVGAGPGSQVGGIPGFPQFDGIGPHGGPSDADYYFPGGAGGGGWAGGSGGGSGSSTAWGGGGGNAGADASVTIIGIAQAAREVPAGTGSTFYSSPTGQGGHDNTFGQPGQVVILYGSSVTTKNPVPISLPCVAPCIPLLKMKAN